MPRDLTKPNALSTPPWISSTARLLFPAIAIASSISLDSMKNSSPLSQQSRQRPAVLAQSEYGNNPVSLVVRIGRRHDHPIISSEGKLAWIHPKSQILFYFVHSFLFLGNFDEPVCSTVFQPTEVTFQHFDHEVS